MSDETSPASPGNVTITGYDYGPLRTYEITWKNGHVERVQGHQVQMPHGGDLDPFGLLGVATKRGTTPRVTIHGQFGEHWRLVMSVDESLIAMVRDVTDGEQFADVIA